MLHLLLVVAAIICAYQVMRSQRLLLVTIWLALTSALVAILLYSFDAPEVAVIELSVGAGLVTVLFVFAFSIVGEDTFDELTIVPRPLVWSLILLVSFLLGWLALPLSGGGQAGLEPSLAQVLWQQRGLDVLAQVMMIFAGVLGLLGLLAETKTPIEEQVTIPAIRQPAVGAKVEIANLPEPADRHPVVEPEREELPV
jgi:uncharacterized MnhB-related membrane protein